MLLRREEPLTRAFRLLFIVIIAALAFPPAASAAPTRAITVSFDILAVQEDTSITIRTRDFPARTQFTVLMGQATRKAADGVEAATFDSGAGGAVEATFPIPEQVRGSRIIGVRIESTNGYFAAYNWFFNRTQANLIPDAKIVPSLAFSEVKRNESVTVEAANLPPLALFRVRVGPHYTFYRDYVTAETVQSDASGAVKFTLPLGKNVQDAEYIAVRLDGGGRYVYAAFSNVDGGAYVPPGQLYRYVPCTLLMINPLPALDPRADFDAVWTVQNTSWEAWNSRRFVFKYLGGTAMHKREGRINLPYTVERGWTVDFAVDMLAPETPGWHTTTWGLVNRDNEVICKMSISVFVKEPKPYIAVRLTVIRQNRRQCRYFQKKLRQPPSTPKNRARPPCCGAVINS